MNTSQHALKWGLALVFACYLLPFVLILFWSFADRWPWPGLLPVFGTRAWSTLLFNEAHTWQAIGLSILIALCVTLLNLVIGLPAAWALTRYTFAFQQWIKLLLFAPIIIPPFISVMGIYTNLSKWGLTDSLLGIILVHLIPTLPYFLRPLIVSLRTLGTDREDQAKMLGATVWQRLRYIIFPRLLPAIVAGASLSILVSLSQYILTFLVGGGLIQTLPIIMFPYISGSDPAIGAAFAVLFSIVCIVTLFVMERLLARYHHKQITLRC